MSGYGDDEGFTAWLAENGYTHPASAPTPGVLRNRGSGYIDGVYGARFSGIPTGGFAQERAWPRTGAYAYCQPIGDNIIPDAVIKASYAAAWQEASSPGSLSVSVTPGRMIKRQKVDGAVEREFFEPGADLSAVEASTLVLSAIEGLLAPFLTSAGALPAILVV
jgi:hypothetical protein